MHTHRDCHGNVFLLLRLHWKLYHWGSRQWVLLPIAKSPGGLPGLLQPSHGFGHFFTIAVISPSRGHSCKTETTKPHCIFRSTWKSAHATTPPPPPPVNATNIQTNKQRHKPTYPHPVAEWGAGGCRVLRHALCPAVGSHVCFASC